MLTARQAVVHLCTLARGATSVICSFIESIICRSRLAMSNNVSFWPIVASKDGVVYRTPALRAGNMEESRCRCNICAPQFTMTASRAPDTTERMCFTVDGFGCTICFKNGNPACRKRSSLCRHQGVASRQQSVCTPTKRRFSMMYFRLAVFLLWSIGAFAQTFRGNLSGVVTDTSETRSIVH